MNEKKKKNLGYAFLTKLQTFTVYFMPRLTRRCLVRVCCVSVYITRVYAPTNTVSARPKIDSIDFRNDTADPNSNITAEIFGEVGWEKK